MKKEMAPAAHNNPFTGAAPRRRRAAPPPPGPRASLPCAWTPTGRVRAWSCAWGPTGCAASQPCAARRGAVGVAPWPSSSAEPPLSSAPGGRTEAAASARAGTPRPPLRLEAGVRVPAAAPRPGVRDGVGWSGAGRAATEAAVASRCCCFYRQASPCPRPSLTAAILVALPARSASGGRDGASFRRRRRRGGARRRLVPASGL